MANIQIPSWATLRRTEEVGGITYLGYSALEESEDSDKWTVSKINELSIVTIEYAEGSWADRAILTYR